MKKKMLTLLIAVLMVALLFAACGGGDTAGPEVTETPEVEATPEPEAEVEEEPEEPEEAEEEIEEEPIDGAPVRGVWDGDIFTSEYLGLQFEKPEDWVVATDEDIMQVMGLLDDGLLGDDFFGEGVDTARLFEVFDITTVHDIMVTDPATGSNIQIAYERLIFPANRMSAAEYIEALGDMLVTMGMEINQFSETTRLGNSDWYSLEAVMDIHGMELLGRYLISVQDGFARIITITYSGDTPELAEDMIARFSDL
ncbi:MAG: hypothetical protein FWE28_02900 [Oscillospiraceae bacterium]|nr:hypothetical protein [Oscillospiraceae bacterium]